MFVLPGERFAPILGAFGWETEPPARARHARRVGRGPAPSLLPWWMLPPCAPPPPPRPDGARPPGGAPGGSRTTGQPGPVRRILGLFRPYLTQVLLVAVAIVLTSGLGVVNPLLIRAVFDHALFC